MALTQTEGFPGKYTAMIVYFLGLKEAWRWVDPQVIEIAVMKNEVFAKTTVDPETGMNIAVLGNVVAIDAALKKIIVKAGLTDTERDWFVGQMNTKTDWVDPQEARRTR